MASYDFLDDNNYQKNIGNLNDTNKQLDEAKKSLQVNTDSQPSSSLSDITNMFKKMNTAETNQKQIGNALGENQSDITSALAGPGTTNQKPMISGNTAASVGFGLSAVSKAYNKFEDRYDYNPKLKAQYQGLEKTKDAIAGAFGPFGSLFRGIESGAKELGAAVGGETGGDVVSGIVDPFSGQMETLSNDESTSFEKIGVVAAPFLSGLFAGAGRKRLERKFRKDQEERDVNKTKREQERMDKEDQIALENLTNLKKSQLNYLNLDI